MDLMFLVYVVNTVTLLGGTDFGFITFMLLLFSAFGFIMSLNEDVWHSSEKGQKKQIHYTQLFQKRY